MKKILALSLALLLILSLSACGGGAGSNNSGASADAGASGGGSGGGTVNIVLATGGTSGGYYAMGGVLQSVLAPHLKLSTLSVESTGASVANINLITDGEAQMAYVQSDVVNYAHNGTYSFESGAETSALWCAAVCNEVVQILARPGINSLSDLKGKVVCVGDVGSGAEANAWQILGALGITENDITAVNGSFTDACDMLRDGKIDATFTGGPPPVTATVDYAMTNPLNMISFSEEEVSAIQEQFPFLVRAVVPGGTYNGLEEDIVSVGVQSTLVASEALSEDVVYEFVKGLFEYQEELAQGHAWFGGMEPNVACNSATIKLHPGAEKYYKEIGVL